MVADNLSRYNGSVRIPRMYNIASRTSVFGKWACSPQGHGEVVRLQLASGAGGHGVSDAPWRQSCCTEMFRCSHHSLVKQVIEWSERGPPDSAKASPGSGSSPTYFFTRCDSGIRVADAWRLTGGGGFKRLSKRKVPLTSGIKNNANEASAFASLT